jgi:hypothetical protein
MTFVCCGLRGAHGLSVGSGVRFLPPCQDFAGVVVGVGPAAAGFSVGDRVFGMQHFRSSSKTLAELYVPLPQSLSPCFPWPHAFASPHLWDPPPPAAALPPLPASLLWQPSTYPSLCPQLRPPPPTPDPRPPSPLAPLWPPPSTSIVVDSGLLAHIPANVPFTEAAGMPLVGFTVWQGLVTRAHVEPGQRVLVLGGSGGTGTVAVQIAHILGAHVTATCSGKNTELVRSLGANVVVDYTQDKFEEVRAVSVCLCAPRVRELGSVGHLVRGAVLDGCVGPCVQGSPCRRAGALAPFACALLCPVHRLSRDCPCCLPCPRPASSPGISVCRSSQSPLTWCTTLLVAWTTTNAPCRC